MTEADSAPRAAGRFAPRQRPPSPTGPSAGRRRPADRRPAARLAAAQPRRPACRWRCGRWRRRATWTTCGWPSPGPARTTAARCSWTPTCTRRWRRSAGSWATTPSPALAEFAAEATALLEKAQQPDGYLNSFVQVTGEPRYAGLASSHELYCAGHLIQAAVAAARTRRRGAAARRAPVRRPPGRRVPGREGRARRPPDHRDRAGRAVPGDRPRAVPEAGRQFMTARPGAIGDSGFGRRYLQDHLPVRETPTLAGHAVRALYLEAGVADVAAETGDRSCWPRRSPAGTTWSPPRRADRRQRLAALGRGVRRRVRAAARPRLQRDLRGDRELPVELAAAARDRGGRYADLMERVALQRLRRRDIRRRAAVLLRQPAAAPRRPLRGGRPGPRREWFSCACCPPNIMRLMASLGHYLATTAGDVLYLHQFTGASVGANLAAGPSAST